MKVNKIFIVILICTLSGQAVFAISFSGNATGDFTTLLPNKEAPSYIQEMMPFIGGFSLEGGVFIPFSYSLSGEINGSFLFTEKKLELDNLYLEYFGDRFSISIGKSQLQWGYGWFSHPSFFPDSFLIDQQQTLFESPALWNGSFTYFFDISNLNIFFIVNNLETNADNIYSGIVRHDLYFQHLALGWDLSFSIENQTSEFHGAVDGEIIFNEKWKIDFAIDYQHPQNFTYLAGFNLNLENFRLIGELSGKNDLLEIDLLSQFTFNDVFSPALVFHYNVSENAGNFTLMLEHMLSKQMEHGFYLNHFIDFDGDFVNFPLIMTYKLILKT